MGNSNLDNVSADIINQIKESLKNEIFDKIPEIGSYLSLNVAQGLRENDKYVVEAFKAMLEKLKYQRDFDIISEAEYYEKLEKLRDKYFSKGTQNWVKYTEEIYAYQKEVLETEKKNITELYGEIADYAEKKLDGILKKQRSAAKEINSFGGLFSVNTVTINGEEDQYTSLHNLEFDIEILKKYGNTIAAIKERISELGIEASGYDMLLSSINSLDVEDALRFSGTLMRASDADFLDYVNNLKIKSKLSEGISAALYEKEFSDGWEDAYENMKKKLLDAGYEIPDGFYTSGSISAQKFGEAFTEGINEQLETVRAKIEEFNASLKIGIDAASGGNIYNTTNTSYNIQASSGSDTVEQIKRFETVKRLSGVI